MYVCVCVWGVAGSTVSIYMFAKSCKCMCVCICVCKPVCLYYDIVGLSANSGKDDLWL